MTSTLRYGNWVVIDDPWVKMPAWKHKVYRFLKLDDTGSWVYCPSIIVIDGTVKPRKIVSRPIHDKLFISFPYIQVGKEWLAENLTPEELAEYVIERMTK